MALIFVGVGHLCHGRKRVFLTKARDLTFFSSCAKIQINERDDNIIKIKLLMQRRTEKFFSCVPLHFLFVLFFIRSEIYGDNSWKIMR